MIKVTEKLEAVNNGGIEAFTFKTTFLIKNSELDISYYTDNKPSTNKYDSELAALGRSLTVTSAETKGFGKLVKKLRLWRSFSRFCKGQGVAAAHIHMSDPLDIIEGMAASAAGAKQVILHSHSGGRVGIGGLKKLAFSVCRMLSGSRKYKLLACSEAAGRFMFGRNDFTVVRNGVDTGKLSYDPELRRNERDRLGISDSFAVGNVGRLCGNKNQSFLLDVFAELMKLRENSVLVIAGDGELSESLKQKANALGISDKVMFLGAVDNVSPLYQALDCFVFPSLSEGLGIAAVEAQTAGLVTVCSDGVPRETGITELCSFMPLSASPKEWAEHIISRTSEYERKSFADEVRAAGYDIKDTAKQLEKIYLSLAEE